MNHNTTDNAEQAADEMAELAAELECAADEADVAAGRARDRADQARGRARAHGDPAIYRRSSDTARRRQLRAKALRAAAAVLREQADTAKERAAMRRHAAGR
jgi:hypothetical protein